MIREFIVPCKINLSLEVLFNRQDGYHELNTVFYRVMEPHDVISVTESEFFRFTCSDASLATGDNLIMKAAHAWSNASGKALPNIHVHLDKRIPMGAGLGGGSSDAAMMLQILDDDEALGEDELRKLVASIGADVPFFLSKEKAAIARGIGDILTPIDMDLNASLLIIFDPNIHVSTKEAYTGIVPNSVATNYSELFRDMKHIAAL